MDTERLAGLLHAAEACGKAAQERITLDFAVRELAGDLLEFQQGLERLAAKLELQGRRMDEIHARLGVQAGAVALLERLEKLKEGSSTCRVCESPVLCLNPKCDE